MASGSGGGPHGLGGSTSYSGFDYVGDAERCYTQVLIRAGEVRDNVENDQLNIQKYVKEIVPLSVDTFQATAKIFEDEHVRVINMVAVVNPELEQVADSTKGSWSTRSL